MTIRTLGPGKFSTVVDQYVYQVSLDGGCDVECNVAGSWYGFLRHGHTIFQDHDPLLDSLNDAERELLAESAGVIIREDSDGFVAVTYYPEMADFDAELDSICEQESQEQD